MPDQQIDRDSVTAKTHTHSKETETAKRQQQAREAGEQCMKGSVVVAEQRWRLRLTG